VERVSGSNLNSTQMYAVANSKLGVYVPELNPILALIFESYADLIKKRKSDSVKNEFKQARL